ncbi:TPA: chromosome partitioning protein ParB [Vibrio parahaemolyticus]|nr:chromosome partitioning protein ParB [Vibrio parahaemolyticus]
MNRNKESQHNNNDIEESIVQGLMEKYQKPPNEYLASSKQLIESSRRKLDRKVMDEIFKSSSQYYPQLKVIDLAIPVQHEVVHISPSVARDMLKFSKRGSINTDLSNRRVNRSAVKKFAEDMNEGRWCLTGEPIIIGHDGEILDGHTRLEAASKSNYGFIAIIIWGISDALAFAHTDTGNIRSRANVLEMAGVSVDAKVLSQVAMLSKAFDMTMNPYAFRGTQGTSFKPAEILDYVQGRDELALSVNKISSLAKEHKQQIQAPQATLAFAHYLINEKLKSYEGDELPITPDIYIANIIPGLGQTSTESIEYKVRDYLESIRKESTSYALLCRLSCIFKGWNMYMGIPVVGKKVSVRRVANFIKNEEGERVPAKAAGNIKEAFTIPFIEPGKTPHKVKKRAAMKQVN